MSTTSELRAEPAIKRVIDLAEIGALSDGEKVAARLAFALIADFGQLDALQQRAFARALGQVAAASTELSNDRRRRAGAPLIEVEEAGYWTDKKNWPMLPDSERWPDDLSEMSNEDNN